MAAVLAKWVLGGLHINEVGYQQLNSRLWTILAAVD
jgi:hypothetical protein